MVSYVHMTPLLEKFLRESKMGFDRKEPESRTPLTDAFVREMESVRVPIELAMHPRLIDQVRDLMIRWAEFARSLEELAAHGRGDE
jgi:hypothetical protein